MGVRRGGVCFQCCRGVRPRRRVNQGHALLRLLRRPLLDNSPWVVALARGHPEPALPCARRSRRAAAVCCIRHWRQDVVAAGVIGSREQRREQHQRQAARGHTQAAQRAPGAARLLLAPRVAEHMAMGYCLRAAGAPGAGPGGAQPFNGRPALGSGVNSKSLGLRRLRRMPARSCIMQRQ